MSWHFIDKLVKRTALGGRGSFVLPSFILEIEPGFVLAAQIDRSTRQVRRMGTRQLEPNSLAPLLNQPNVSNPEELQRAIGEVREAVGGGSGRLGLLVPDPMLRVAILSFETLPKKKQEVDALVQWRLKELLPFAPEEARLSYQVLSREPGGVELLAVAAKNSILAEYETAVSRANGGPALTLPATAALLPLLRGEDAAGQLLIHVCSDWVTTVVMAGNHPRAWRTRDLTGMDVPGLVRAVAREAARVDAGSRDHLKVAIERVHISLRPPAPQELISEVQGAVSCQVSILAPADALAAASIPAAEAAIFQEFGATVAGVVSNSAREL